MPGASDQDQMRQGTLLLAEALKLWWTFGFDTIKELRNGAHTPYSVRNHFIYNVIYNLKIEIVSQEILW